MHRWAEYECKLNEGVEGWSPASTHMLATGDSRGKYPPKQLKMRTIQLAKKLIRLP